MEAVEVKDEKIGGKWSKWEIEDAARTLMEAEKIKKDSEMMPYVMEEMEAKQEDLESSIKSIDDLRKRASEIRSGDDED